MKVSVGTVQKDHQDQVQVLHDDGFRTTHQKETGSIAQKMRWQSGDRAFLIFSEQDSKWILKGRIINP